jgi:hypothetical protein
VGVVGQIDAELEGLCSHLLVRYPCIHRRVCHGHTHLSLKLSLPIRCTGLSRYSIIRRCPVLISAVMFMPGLRRRRRPSVAPPAFAPPRQFGCPALSLYPFVVLLARLGCLPVVPRLREGDGCHCRPRPRIQGFLIGGIIECLTAFDKLRSAPRPVARRCADLGSLQGASCRAAA